MIDSLELLRDLPRLRLRLYEVTQFQVGVLRKPLELLDLELKSCVLDLELSFASLCSLAIGLVPSDPIFKVLGLDHIASIVLVQVVQLLDMLLG